MESPLQYALRSVGQHEFWAQKSLQSKVSRTLCDVGPLSGFLPPALGRQQRALQAKHVRRPRKVEGAQATVGVTGKSRGEEAAGEGVNLCDIPGTVLFTIIGFDEPQMNMVSLIDGTVKA